MFKKSVAFFAMVAFVGGGVFASEDESLAAASPTSFSVDCTDDTTLNASTTVAGKIERIVSGGAGDTFTITNTSTSTACTVTILDATVGSVSSTSIAANNGEVTFTIGSNSGGYTIGPQGGAVPVTFAIDTVDCALAGAGIESAPFLVGTIEDFQIVGDSGCELDAHYLQTANITGVDTTVTANIVVVDSVNGLPFQGVYDGDHYTIGLSSSGFSDQVALFGRVGGTIKRLRLSGQIESSAELVAPLVSYLDEDGLISEVKSSVLLESNRVGAILGGIVGQVNDNGTRVQYSAAVGRIYWDVSSDGDGPAMGGLVGSVNSAFEVRDSYSRVSFQADSSDIDTSCPDTTTNQDVYVGGLVGDLHDDAFLTIVRSYVASSFSDTAISSACVKRTKLGGLVGLVEDSADLIDSNVVSAFWLSTFSPTAVGVFDELGADGTSVDDSTELTTALAKYDLGDPVAAPLSAALLKTRSTYESAEDAEVSNIPSGDSDLSLIGTGGNEDHRWAIEEISVQTFVESSYDFDGSGDYPGDGVELQDHTNRVALDNTVARSYRTKGAGDLTVHGGSDFEIVNANAYPTIGRVWDICNDYPTLVWEEINSCTGTGGSSRSSNDDGDDDSSTAASAAALGLTVAEYEAFLASGLTLEQFLAQRLAATGSSAQALHLSVLAALSLLVLGLGLTLISRRQRTLG